MNRFASWSERRVVICGGTSGLGLQLVISVAKQHAKIVIIGRDQEKLRDAQRIALESGASSANTYSLDLSNADLAAQPDFNTLGDDLSQNPVDLLINAVGRSDRGALELLEVTDLEKMFQDNVLCTWNMIRICLDSLKRAKGTLVNIGSLAGIVSPPNFGGYCVAKAALTAMTRQLRLELEPHGVHVMLVCPGPIRRDDSGTRYRELAQARGLDAASAAPAGGVSLKLIDPAVLSDRILACALRGQDELVVPGKTKLLAALSNVWPWLADRVLRRYLKKP